VGHVCDDSRRFRELVGGLSQRLVLSQDVYQVPRTESSATLLQPHGKAPRESSF
jgi:hypothetical protein